MLQLLYLQLWGLKMAQSVRLSDSLVKQAKVIGEVMSRSGAGQIEHWARIGKIAEENPDLSYGFIRDSLLAKAEIDNGLVDDYEFDH
jgi:hypothetical protein